jgi:hypothetical protein
MHIWQENGITYSGEVLPIQVVRKTKHRPEDRIISIIKRKLRYDLKGNSLVCHILTPETIDWGLLNKEVSSLNPILKDITIVGRAGDREFVVGRIYPDVYVQTINLASIELAAPQIVEMTETTIPEKTGVVHLGTALLVPTFKIK